MSTDTTRQPKVLLVAIDGCRPDVLMFANTPEIKRLLLDSAYSLHAPSVLPVLSGPNWASIFTGASVQEHGVRDNKFSNSRLNSCPTLPRLLKRANPRITTAAVLGGWSGMKHIIGEDVDEVHWFNPEDMAGGVPSGSISAADAADAAAAEKGVEVLGQRDSAPDLTVVYFDAVDCAGHDHGFSASAPQYVAAVQQADQRVGALARCVRQREGGHPAEDWLVLLTTDHGGTARASMGPRLVQAMREVDEEQAAHGYSGYHGLDIPQHRMGFFIAANARGVQRGELLPAPIPGLDVTPTVLFHLGCDAGDLAGSARGFAGGALEALNAQAEPPLAPTATTANAAATVAAGTPIALHSSV